jgi:arylsulfatase A-like enzyme
MWGPGFQGGGRVRELVSLIDLPPTLLDAAGLQVPEAMQGKSALPLAQQRDVEWPDDMFLQISESQVGRAVRTRRWKYSVSAPDKNPVQDAASDSYTEEFLYDLYSDPWELNNLIASTAHRSVKQVMRERLVRRMTEAGEKAPHIETAQEKPSGQLLVLDRECRE